LELRSHYHKNQIKLQKKPFAGGGEGDLFHILHPKASSGNFIAKLYHPHKLSSERQAKLQYLYKNNPVNLEQQRIPSLVWVTDLLYDSKNKLRGFVMPFVKGEKLEMLCMPKLPKNTSQHWQRFNFKSANALDLRMRLCFNIAVAIYQLHSTQNYVLVDLKPDNIMVQPNGIIALVDLDSVEVIEGEDTLFDAPVATPEYTPAEFYIQDQLDHDPTARQEWDLFSMTVIFYKLLFGIHPFAAGNKPPYDNCLTLEQKIEKGLFVHNPAMQDYMDIIPPPHRQFEKLPKELQELFIQCFGAGHHNPRQRPTSEEWCVAFLKAIDDPKLHKIFDHLFAVKSFDFRHEHDRKLPSEIYNFEKIQEDLEEQLLPDFLAYKPGDQDIKNVPKRYYYQFSYENGSIRPLVWGVGISLTVLLSLANLSAFSLVYIILGVIITIMLAELFDQMVFINTPQYQEKIRVENKLKSIQSLYRRKLSSWKSSMRGIKTAYLEAINKNLNQFLNEKRDYFTNLIQTMDQKVKTLVKLENKSYEQSYQKFVQRLKNHPLLSNLQGDNPTEMKTEIFTKREDAWKDQIKAFNEISFAYRDQYLEDKKAFDEKYQRLIIQNRNQFLDQKDEVLDYKNEVEKITLDHLRVRFPIEIGEKYMDELEKLYTELLMLTAEERAFQKITLKNFRSGKNRKNRSK
jgi:serine/threonine protein kinase